MDWGEYLKALDAPYHQHRLAVLRAMLPTLPKGKVVVDFGCGDGSLLSGTYYYTGIDKSPVMVEAARKRWGRALLGGVEQLANVGQADLVIAANVLAYMPEAEVEKFYQEAKRILGPTNGYLLVTHSNELFDLFGLNHRTIEFIERNFTDGPVDRKLPRAAHLNDWPTRENPITFPAKLLKLGFAAKQTEYMHQHRAVPHWNMQPEDVLKVKEWPDTLNVDKAERWKLMFTCPSFATLAIA